MEHTILLTPVVWRAISPGAHYFTLTNDVKGSSPLGNLWGSLRKWVEGPLLTFGVGMVHVKAWLSRRRLYHRAAMLCHCVGVICLRWEDRNLTERLLWKLSAGPCNDNTASYILQLPVPAVFPRTPIQRFYIHFKGICWQCSLTWLW